MQRAAEERGGVSGCVGNVVAPCAGYLQGWLDHKHYQRPLLFYPKAAEPDESWFAHPFLHVI